MGEQTASMTDAERSSGRWQTVAAVGGILFGLVNFYEPIKDIYKRFADPAAYKDVVSVQYADMQRELWQKNGSCLLSMNMQQVPLGNNVELRAGSCENRDILVQMYPENQPAISHWMSLASIGQGSMSTSALFPSAFAQAMTPGLLAQLAPGAGAQKAQVQISTVCQAWEDEKRQARLIRVTKENGQCWKEITNVFSGRIEYREPAACDATCTPPAPPS
jgi:hypothetical protein